MLTLSPKKLQNIKILIISGKRYTRFLNINLNIVQILFHDSIGENWWGGGSGFALKFFRSFPVETVDGYAYSVKRKGGWQDSTNIYQRWIYGASRLILAKIMFLFFFINLLSS